ncbi:MAG: hypothetical protein ACTHMD_17470 [Flavisolibacter sp.]
MKKFTTSFIFCLAAMLSFFSAAAQNIDSTLAKYNSSYQAEKVWLHYDKQVYHSGETIWFKAYLMEGLYPANETKNLYVDWVADNGEVLWHTVSPVVEASTSGQFDIPENFNGNFIHVRAYTKWMLNFDTAFLYKRDIRVFGKTVSAKQNAKPAPVATIQFFAEGGDAIAGVTNKIAFKAVDQWGTPVKVKGTIRDNKGAVVDSFHSVHDGMGTFFLLPQEGISYTAKWKDEKGTEHTTALPSAKPVGVSMQIGIDGTKRYINLQSGNNLPDNLKLVHIIGTISQGEAFKTDASFASGNNVRKLIPTENLPSGILTITMFDASWNAIAERITFINNHEYVFQPQFEVQHWGLNKRARNEIEITVPDSLGGANLSISVTDTGIERDTTNNIISHFLLTGDIKGSVYNPAYYFANNEDSTVQNLDLVMLTNGWRRFKWEDVVKGKFPAITYPKDSSYLSLSGQVYGVSKSLLTGKESVLLLIKEKDSANKMMLMPLNSNGTFNDPNFIFFDTLKVYYQLKSKLFGSADARFMTDRLPAPNYIAASKNFATLNPLFDTAGNYRHSLLAAEALSLQNLDKGKVMENVTVTAKTKPPLQVMDEKYAKGLFSGSDAYQFDLVNDPFALGRTDIFSYLQGKVAGLQITTGGTPSLSWRGGTPQLYLDEMPIDADFLNSVPVSDIAYVKVFRPPFMGSAGGGAGGAIAIYTRRGDDVKSKAGGLSSNTVMGYTPIKEFYSPNYDRFDKRNEQKDVRTTLYWNPMVITTPQKRSVKLNFYNNDVSKSFRVVIEGMTKEGLLTHYEEIME